jgi:uncharacterized membrane protein
MVLLIYLYLNRFSTPLAQLFCYTRNCNDLVLAITEKVPFAVAGAVTAALLAIFSFFARQSKWCQALAFLLALWSAGICFSLIIYQAQILKSFCVFCLISSGLFFLVLIILCLDLRAQLLTRKKLDRAKSHSKIFQ